MMTPAAHPADPYVGRILLGKYRCLERVAEGAVSVVYKVQHAKLAGLRAMKVLREEHRGDPYAAEGFWREARLASIVVHPSVVTLHDVDTLPDAAPCSIWEYVEGPTLAARVAGGPLAADEAAAVARGLCGALQCLHGKGLAHLDLHPTNVLLPAAGAVEGRDVCLLDLGEALPLGSAAERRLEVLRLGFSAPEQVEESGPLDARADVFALGALLCFVLTGSPPLVPPDLPTYRHELKRLVPARLLAVQKLPPGLRAVVERCLAPAPTERPPNAGAVRDAIRQVARDTSSGSMAAVGASGAVGVGAAAPIALATGPAEGDAAPAEVPTERAMAEDLAFTTIPLTPVGRPPAAGARFAPGPAPGARLEAIEGGDFGPFALGDTAHVGRADDNSVLIDHPTVSKHHAKVRYDNGEYFIEDLGGRNGTGVNGRRVRGTAALADGDTVTFGDVVLRFRIGA